MRLPVISRHLVAALTSAFLAAALPEAAEAACNAIPDAGQLYASSTMQPPGEGALRYRSAIGLIDRPFVAMWTDDPATELQTVIVGPNRACPGPEFDGPFTQVVAGDEELAVALVFRSADGPSGVVLLAPPEDCARIKARAEDAAEPPFRRIHCASTGAVVPIEDGDERRIGIAFPHERDFEPLRAAGIRTHGEVSIAVFLANEPLPIRLANETCAQVAPGFTGLLCFDQMFADVFERCGTGPGDVDPGVTAFMVMAKENDFARLCRKRQNDPPLLTRCREQDDDLELTVDDAGVVRTRFYWQPILPPGIGNGSAKRELGGSTAIPKFDDQSGAEVRIPGREFLASTDHWGGGNPHKPLFAPEARADRPNELNLMGAADKVRSTLSFYPRMLVTKVCKAAVSPPFDFEEACDGVKNSNANKCVCDDRSGCSCRTLDDAQVRFFTCEGGTYPGQPCTRPSHCRDVAISPTAGKCTGTPACWKVNSRQLIAHDCSLNKDCKQHEATAGEPLECGEPLFDLRSRRDPTGLVVITRAIAVSDPERAVCDIEGQAGDGDRCGPPGICAGVGECVRFRLEAREKLP